MRLIAGVFILQRIGPIIAKYWFITIVKLFKNSKAIILSFENRIQDFEKEQGKVNIIGIRECNFHMELQIPK